MITWRCWSKTLSALLATSKIVTFATRLNTSQGRINIVLILILVGALPTWGHSRSWGYGPSGGLGLVVLILVVLLLMGKI